MFKGFRSTAKSESDVNALAGVKSPPSRVNAPNETTVTTTGMLLSMKLLNCKKGNLLKEKTNKLREHGRKTLTLHSLKV